MREIIFIKQNKEKWLEIQQIINGKIKKNPDDLSSLYINLVNDLAFAQTYYPKSKTTSYLNYLSSQIFQRIYKTKRVERNFLVHFFLTDVPLIMYQYRKYLFLAFSFFFIFIAIGVISAHYDLEFTKLILGEEYVNRTIENIENNNATGVYQDGSNWGSAIAITINNLKVGANLFVGGIFAGVGTLLILGMNGIMVGSFQYFFYQHGALEDSMRGIWIHGTFEIFAMVIEAMAGLILGSSILFPKTYSRLASLKIGAKNAIKIFVSTIPFTIIAGILEGFVTRYAPVMDEVFNSALILGMLGLISFYYFIYPYIIHKKLTNDVSVLQKERFWTNNV